MPKPSLAKFAVLLVGFVVSVSAIVFFEGASNGPSEPPNPVASALVRAASSLRKVLPGGAHAELIKRTDLHGHAPAEVARLLGKQPADSHPVKLSDGLTEFQIELYNFFPPEDPSTAQVVVLEESWDFDGYNVTVWYRHDRDRWTAFDSFEYPDGLEF